MTVTKVQMTLLAVVLLACTASAQKQVRVFSKEEALNAQNTSTPRIYIQNTGTEPISNFYYHYYFRTENGNTPTFQGYYTPACAVTLEGAGDGVYYLRYNFSGFTLEPGEIQPNTSGNSVGIMYPNWSPWDKNNDLSNNLSTEFAMNGQIPVFLSDGTQIYGNGLPDPQNPPQPPVVKSSLGNYAVFSTEFTDLRDRAVVKGGNAGSKVYTEIGCDAVIKGSILSGGNIFLRERS